MRSFFQSWAAIMVALVFVAAPRPGAAQGNLPPGVELQATVEPKNVIVGDTFRYTVRLIGGIKVDEINFPTFGKLKGIRIRSGPNESATMQFVNGVTHTEKSWTFELIAEEQGTFEVDPTRLRISGIWHETEPVQFVVRDSPLDNGALGNIISARTRHPELNRQLHGRYFARMEAPESAYRGQAIPIKLYIYRDPALPEFDTGMIVRAAGGQDFLTPQTNDPRGLAPSRLSWERVKLGNQEFARTLFQTIFAVPTKSGDLTLEPPQVIVMLPVVNRYRDTFGAPREQAELPMRSQKLKVLQIPEKPDDAALQIVGDVGVEVKADRGTLKEGELLSISVKFTGSAFLDLVSPPEMPKVENLILIDRRPKDLRSDIRNGIYLSQKEFDIVYQARTAGKTVIPALKFAIFDPERQQQRIVESKPIEVTIEKGTGSSTLISSAAIPGGVGEDAAGRPGARQLGSDIAWIDESPLTLATVAVDRSFYSQPWFWAMQLVPLGLAIGLGLVAVRSRHSGPETATMRAKRGRKAAQEALRTASGKLRGTGRDEFYSTVYNGVMSYVASLLNRSAAGLTVEEVQSALEARGLDGEAAARTASVLRHCDEMRFSPVADSEQERQRVLDEAAARIEEIESGARRA